MDHIEKGGNLRATIVVEYEEATGREGWNFNPINPLAVKCSWWIMHPGDEGGGPGHIVCQTYEKNTVKRKASALQLICNVWIVDIES